MCTVFPFLFVVSFGICVVSLDTKKSGKSKTLQSKTTKQLSKQASKQQNGTGSKKRNKKRIILKNYLYLLFCVLFLVMPPYFLFTDDTTNKNTRAQALYTFHTSRTSNVAEHFAAASISKPITPNTPDTNFTFEQGANTNDNDNNNTNNLNIIDHQRTATQDSMSNTEDSFIIHQQSNNSVFGGIGNNYKTPNNLSVQPSPHLNITDKSEDEISALSKDPENPIEDQTDDDYDDDGSVHMKKEASPGSTKINPVPNAPGGISGQPRGNTLSVQKNGKNRGNSASPGARGVGTRGSAHTSPNNGGHGRGHETSDSDDDEDDEEFNDDPEFNAMQQQMATMWENEIQKVSSGGHGGSDGMQQMLESFMHFNHDLNMERPETAPDMFGVPKELREKPYLEVRDLLEALPYNLSFAILREQEMNYPSDKIKDILIQRGCWPMVRFQTRKGKIISVNLKRTVPFSDVLTKLEVWAVVVICFLLCRVLSFFLLCFQSVFVTFLNVQYYRLI